MKKFNQVKIVLFDSTMAQFKLSVEALFTRGRPDGTSANLAYITDKGVANLNPSIYLVLSYKGDSYENTKNLYTSYPQLFRIRRAVEAVKDLLVDEKGFTKIENILTVRPENSEPIVIAGIGKGNKTISFRLAAVDSTNENLPGKLAGVTIQLSDSEYASVLTAEEFLTVYSIIMDLDLASIQVQLTTLFLMGEYDSGMATQPVFTQPYYQQPAPQYQQYPGYSTAPTLPQPIGPGVTNSTSPAYQQQGVRQQPAPRYGNSPIQRPAPQIRPAPQQEPAPLTHNQLPPRREKPIVNINAVSQTPVSPISFNDEDAIDAIFDPEE